MVAWVLYLTAIGFAMGVAGLLSERALQHLGRPVRWVWLWAMVGTIGIPIVAAGGGGMAGAPGAAELGASVAGAGRWPWSGIPAALTAPGVDVVLLAVWFVLSLVLLGNIRLSAWTVRRNERSWRAGSLGEERVLLSRGFGPGVIGVSRPRIVLPEWVLEVGPSLRRIILVHETEHVRARDTTLLLVGMTLVILVPWCVSLWWQLHRLRRAVESDCDGRVLAITADRRGYARALVAVAGRRTAGLLPAATLAPARGELEHRVRRITAGRRGRSRPAGLGLTIAAVGMVVGLAGVPLPDPPRPNLEFRMEPARWSVTRAPREARVILSVEDEEPEASLRSD